MPGVPQSLSLKEAVVRLLDLEYVEPFQLGQSLRVMIDVFRPSKRELEEMTHELVNSLRDSKVLEDAEFWEGVDKALRPRHVVRSFRENFLEFEEQHPDTPCRFCSLMCALAPIVDVQRGNLHELRSHASPAHIRSLVARLADATVDNVASLAELLRRFFHPSEQFEVAEALSFCLKSDWFPDVVPRDVDKARAVFRAHLVSAFPSTQAVLENYLENFSCAGAEDEDQDSAGSLCDFIVDDDQDTGAEDEDEDDLDSHSGSEEGLSSSGSYSS